MIWFTLEYDSRDEVREAVQVLVQRHNVTGEMSLRKADNGKWILNVSSEKNLRDSTIEKLRGDKAEVSS